MDSFLMSRVEKLINVNDAIKREFRWSSDVCIGSFASLIYALSDKNLDIEELKDTQQFIKSNTGILSHYRFTEKFTVPALLIAKFENPKVAFEYMLMYEDKLNKVGFIKNPMLGIASYALLLTCRDELVDMRINKVREIYNCMKNNHFWLTGHDDYALSVLISALERNIDSIMVEIEGLYDMLHWEGLSKSNGLQQLSHILALSADKSEDKVKRCMDVFRFFRSNKIGIYPKDYGVMGLITLAGASSDMLGEVLQAYSFLKDDVSFKLVPKEINLLIACSLSCDKYIRNNKENCGINEASAGVSIEAIIACMVGASAAIASTSEN